MLRSELFVIAIIYIQIPATWIVQDIGSKLSNEFVKFNEVNKILTSCVFRNQSDFKSKHCFISLLYYV